MTTALRALRAAAFVAPLLPTASAAAQVIPSEPVTFGAGGSTKEGTWNTVMELHAEGRQVAPHISCIGTTRASVRELLDGYRSAGIRRLVALRGDLPSGAAGGAGDFRYANELVEFITGRYNVSANSVITYANSPPFEQRNGFVRLGDVQLL